MSNKTTWNLIGSKYEHNFKYTNQHRKSGSPILRLLMGKYWVTGFFIRRKSFSPLPPFALMCRFCSNCTTNMKRMIRKPSINKFFYINKKGAIYQAILTHDASKPLICPRNTRVGFDLYKKTLLCPHI